MKQEQLKQIFLTNVLAATLAMEGIEALQGTQVYRHELKSAGRTFLRQLELYSTGPLSAIWGNDDKGMYTIMEYQKQLLNKIALLKPEDAGVVSAMLDKYAENPEAVLKQLEIQLVDSDGVPVETAA